MPDFYLLPKVEFQRVYNSSLDKTIKMELIADMCRLNTFMNVKKAGSGHLGSSFSAMDIVIYLYYKEMNTVQVGFDHPDRDIYFSSKGHDVPGLYSVLYSLGVLGEERFLKLRRYQGTHGHPDVSIPGMEANSGSLGMGVSKGKGMAIAKKLAGRKGRVIVMLGDGELQEGQIYESLLSTVNRKVNNLIVIVDHNKVQSDKYVSEISNLGNLEEKFLSFGWYVKRCDGHDYGQLESVFREFETVNDKPKIVITDTIKGKGISFMEHPNVLKDSNSLYCWHAGAPADESFELGYEELKSRINQRLINMGLSAMDLLLIPMEKKVPSGISQEFVADGFGKALVELGAKRKDLIVLDADLSADCRIREFENTFPEQFIECGIAEQDMVSTAGGLALQGFLPVVNSFGSFLSSRSNEQIYTNNTERSRIIYCCHYAGLIPAGPGQSHQCVRDISLFACLQNLEILQPCNALEAKMILEYCVNQSNQNAMIRLNIGPSPRIIELPDQYELTWGQGVAITEGEDAILFSYGPVMLHEALIACELLHHDGFGLKVVNMPWLNRIDYQWFEQLVKPYKKVFTLDDHSIIGGLGDFILNAMHQTNLIKEREYEKHGVKSFLACGTPLEALKHHQLDGESFRNHIHECFVNNSVSSNVA